MDQATMSTTSKNNSRRETAEEKQKRVNEFWSKLIWELSSCDEATNIFPDMTVCPVCNATLERVELTGEFVMVHKSFEDILN